MKISMNRYQLLLSGFLSFILIGTVLLMLPLSTVQDISLVDALFTATSAVCVTGLIVKDTPNDFTIFGQFVIVLLIQIGGLGYMTMTTIISLVLEKKIGMKEKVIIKETLSFNNHEGTRRFIVSILLMTVFFEFAGTLFLSFAFKDDYSMREAIYYGFFHSISAFNNAGFSLFSVNLINYSGDIIVTFTITVLIIFGGMGFVVFKDILNFLMRRKISLSLHCKIVLVTTLILIVLGTLFIYIFESSNPDTFQKMTFKESVLNSYFSAVTPRTAGFNIIDYSKLEGDTLFFTLILMLIGAAPGSTGGGIKVTTFAVILLTFYAYIRRRRDTEVFERRISFKVTVQSLILVTFSIAFIFLLSLLILICDNTSLFPTFFEVTSAFGTVGLSLGDGGVKSFSALLSPLSKLLICFTMLAGRLGPLTLAIAMIQKKKRRFRYPEEQVFIG
jgi:trk system potassium uptake protein TrkH